MATVLGRSLWIIDVRSSLSESEQVEWKNLELKFDNEVKSLLLKHFSL